MQKTNGQVALELAALGIPVLPLHHPVARDDDGKGVRWGLDCSCGRLDCPRAAAHPLYGEAPNGSVQPLKIQTWWAQHPGANVGVQTGQTCDVVDTDAALGRLMLSLLDRAGQPRPPVSEAGDGRWQWWMAATLGLPTCNIGPADPRDPFRVVIHGTGGFVVAPPSRFLNGTQVDWCYPVHVKFPSATTVLQVLLDAHSRMLQHRQLGPPNETAQPALSSPRRAARSLPPTPRPATV